MNRLFAATLVAAVGSVPVAAWAAPATCAVDHQPARIARSIAPEYPPMAKIQNLSGLAEIRVDISDAGRVVNANVVKSSGSTILDDAALAAVDNLEYAPEVTSCKAVPGSYIVGVDFP